MAEYLANQVQTVALNTPVILNASIPCRKGFVIHEDGTGVFILRGTNNCRARYSVTFNANIAVPTGGTVGPIAVAIVMNGEPILTSRAIATPAAVGDYFNVTATKNIDIPAGCCFNIAIEPVTPYNDTTTPAQAIDIQNSNLVINRVA
jgi:hypothetical protein